MGPEATLDLFQKIISNSTASCDQEHLPLLIDNNPQIPDRSAYLLNKGENPFPYLLNSAKKLETQGADALCMPCNTAHYFLKQIRKEISIPFISIIESTFQTIKREMPSVKKIGLMATTGTVKTRIYDDVFKEGEIEILNLCEDSLQQMMNIIYNGVKAGNIESQIEPFETLVKEIVDLGAEAIIAGCTEIPMLVQYIQPPIPFFDPTLILAKKVVKHGYS